MKQRLDAFGIDERLCLKLVTGAAILVLTLAGIALRFYRLSDLPPGLHFDEAVNGINALLVLQGKHSVFFPESTGREAMVVYLAALSVAQFGRTVLALRLPLAIASVSSVLAVFWLGRVLFEQDIEGRRYSPWRGVIVGAVGAGLMAVSIGQTFMGRMAFRANLLPLFLTVSLALLWLGWRQRSWRLIALAGIGTGLIPYTYIPARFVPFLFLFLGLSFLLSHGSLSKSRIRTILPLIGLFLGTATVVAAPILIHFALNPNHFFMRSSQLWIFDDNIGAAKTLSALIKNVWEYLLIFGIHSDQYWQNYTVKQMMLYPLEALFFWLGVGLALRRWRDPTYRLLLLWLGVMLLPGILAVETGTNTFGSHHFIRLSGAAPAIYLLASVGVWDTFLFLEDKLPKNFTLKPAVLVSVLVGGFFLVQGVNTYRTYFQNWAHEPDMPESYGTAWTKLAQALNGQPFDDDTVYLIHSSHPHWRYSLEYLYQGSAAVRVIDVFSPNLAGSVERVLADVDRTATAKIVEWGSEDNYVGDDIEALSFLFDKYGRYLGTEQYAEFSVHEYTDVSLDRSWTLYDYLEPITVRYDGGIALTGIALGQGQDQLASHESIEMEQERSLWCFLQWRIGPSSDVDYAMSLRLYNDSGEIVYQADNKIRKLTNNTPTSDWTENEVVDSLFHIDIPADLQSGSYDLRLVVYDFETQIPTVEIDVWQPEVTLASLHLTFPPSATAKIEQKNGR